MSVLKTDYWGGWYSLWRTVK